MRTMKPGKRIRRQVLIRALVMMVVVVPGAAAQGAGAPDLGAGWELQLAEGMPVGSVVAASPEAGFVVLGIDGGAFWSSDGMDWQSITNPMPIRDLGANDRGFVAVGNSEPVSSVQFSADGRTWERVDVGMSASFLRVESGPAGFLLVGEKDCDVLARFSSDGRDWLPVDLPKRCGSLLAAQLGDGWVAVAERNEELVVLSSEDGIEWDVLDASGPPPRLPATLSFFPGFEELFGLASLSSDDETLVLAGSGTEGMWVSVDDGNTWASTEIDPGPVEMAVSDLGFVGVSPQRVLFSADGTSWTEFPVEMVFRDVAAIGDTVVALATDGIYTWIAAPAPLAETGTNPSSLLWLAAILSAIGGATLILRRHVIRRTSQAVS